LRAILGSYRHSQNCLKPPKFLLNKIKLIWPVLVVLKSAQNYLKQYDIASVSFVIHGVS